MVEKLPFVSVIIVAYNQKSFLEKSLPVIYRQNYEDFEVIVVDSGSSDGSIELYKEYPVKVVKYVGPTGKRFNYATAFNLAVEKSVGDIYVRLSGDVIPVSEDWLIELIKPFENKEVAGVYSHQLHGKDSDLHHKFLSFFMFSPYRDYFEKLAPGFMFWGASAGIRRSCFEEVPFSEKQRRGEDVLWGAEMARRGYKILYSPNSKVIHNHHKEDAETIVAVAGSLKRFLKMYPPYMVHMILRNLSQEVNDFRKGYKEAYEEKFNGGRKKNNC